MFPIVERANIMLGMYKAEYKSKELLVSNSGLRNCKNNDEGLVLLSVWLNQPNLRTKELKDLDELCDIEMSVIN